MTDNLHTTRSPQVEVQLPGVITKLSSDAHQACIEFFIAQQSNPNTRKAYLRAVTRFCA